MSHHKEIQVTAPDGSAVRVDERLGRLLPALWERGIKTRYSCQGKEQELAYILFDDLASADAFCRIIYRRTWKWECSKEAGRGSLGLRITVRFPTGDIRRIEKAMTSPVKNYGLRSAA